jgi:ribosomal protein S21
VGQHYNGNGRDIHKRGLAVEVKPAFTPEQALKNLDSAMRTLKRRVVQEGLIRDMRRKEYAETKGQVARKKRQEAVRRQKKKNRLQES